MTANILALPLILSCVALNVAAQLLLKMGMRCMGPVHVEAKNFLPLCGHMLTNWPILGGTALYVVSLFLWIVTLSRVDVSYAYPMTSLGYVLTALCGWWLFNEGLTPMRILGVLIIMIGVILVARS